MRVLLDECVPRKFRNFLPGYDCHTVPEEGLAGKKNGELLSLAEKSGFQVFLTLDRGVEYEQKLSAKNYRCDPDSCEIKPSGRSVDA